MTPTITRILVPVDLSSNSVRALREPRHVARRSRGAVAAAILLAGLLAPVAALPAAAQGNQPPAEERMTPTGPDVFRTHCATCHGSTARGDGVLASSMRRKPADLTGLASRNGGQYPSEMVYRTIDGRQPVRGHGGPDMPVWGDIFLKSRYGGDEAAVKELVTQLVKFLESIQARAGQ